MIGQKNQLFDHHSAVIYVNTAHLDFSSFFLEWAVEDSGCRTPDKGVGDCVPISDCQPMKDVLSRIQRPVPDAVLKKIQAYACGASRSGVKVSTKNPKKY